MNIEINPETERLVREEISSGHFRSVDDLIVTGINAWRKRISRQPIPQVLMEAFVRDVSACMLLARSAN